MAADEGDEWAETLKEYLLNDEGTEQYKAFASNWREMPLRNDVINDVIRGCDAGCSGLKEAFDQEVDNSSFVYDANKTRFAYAWTRGFALAVLDVLYSTQPNEVIPQCYSLALKKHADYGSENIQRYAEVGIIVRTTDKLARIANLLRASGTANFETLTDTLQDVVVYATYGMILQDNLWVA